MSYSEKNMLSLVEWCTQKDFSQQLAIRDELHCFKLCGNILADMILIRPLYWFWHIVHFYIFIITFYTFNPPC
jgi:hypothetical protein